MHKLFNKKQIYLSLEDSNLNIEYNSTILTLFKCIQRYINLSKESIF